MMPSRTMLLAIVCAASALQMVAGELGNTDQSFEDFTQAHNKSYADEDEQTMRRDIFETTRKSVLLQNAAFSAGASGWWATINRFSDFTKEELASMRAKPAHGVKFGGETEKTMVANFAAESTGNPQSKSWMSVQSEVKNQGGCGSCWAFATTEVLESHLAIAEKSTTVTVLAPQTLVNCVKNPNQCGGTGGCEGATAEIGFNYTQASGMALESDLPYSGRDSPCEKYTSTVTCSGYVKVKKNSAVGLETALATVGPVAVTVSANWATYGGGIFSDGCSNDPPESCTLDHAVVAVAYTQDYWLIRNSWGASWGEKGFIRLTRKNDGVTYTDSNPADGDACKPFPAEQKPMGESGVLFDTCYPTGVKRSSN